MTRPVHVGLTLPQFRDDPEPALAVAAAAEAAGLDGVFVFDHLWPLHQPERPALYSLALLGALAATTERITLGTLVARVGLLPDAVLVHALATLHRMAGGRFVAGLGTGDGGNRAENEAFGVPFPPKAERVRRLAVCCDLLRERGVPTWVGGNSEEVRTVAGARAGAWNAWAATPEWFRSAGAGLGVPLTWGGQVLIGRTAGEAGAKLERHGTRPGLVHGTVETVARHLRVLADAGATWVVCAPLDVGTDPAAVELVAEVAAALR